VTVPSAENEAAHRRENLAMEKAPFAAGNGYPYDPTGDAMADGIGPGSWTPRADVPELDGHGHPKIVPMGQTEAYRVSAGRDPRGLPVMAGDGEIVGTVSDMWIDAPEQLVRYLEIELDSDHGGGTRLVPMTFSKIGFKKVKINSVFGKHFAGVPVTKSGTRSRNSRKRRSPPTTAAAFSTPPRTGSIRCSEQRVTATTVRRTRTMPHDHDDFQTEPVRGLPENLPEGEYILWQGQTRLVGAHEGGA
jgi:sporulation protein YlmC with PRC-barrel domain